MMSYWFERSGKMWRVYAYRDTQRLYAVQDCFTRKQAKELCERLKASQAAAR
jgi:hypothetical protein